jgi:hypothetical protein
MPRLEANNLRDAIARSMAAAETVAIRPRPETPAGIEARESMSARAQLEQGRISEVASSIVRSARVFQGGGNEIAGDSFDAHVGQALNASLSRLYPNFGVADKTGWDKVFDRAAQGAGDSMSAVGHTGDVDQHPVSQEIRSYIGGIGKKGLEIRRHFMAPPFGWPQDAVDGALVALLSAGFVRASRNGQSVGAIDIKRPLISASDFFSEGITVGAQHRIGVRSLASRLGISAISGSEADAADRILDRLTETARAAGGAPPLPDPPNQRSIQKIRAQAGNEQLLSIYDARDELAGLYANWSRKAHKADQRSREWALLKELSEYAQPLACSKAILIQIEAICENRSLLQEPNPLTPALNRLRSSLREAISNAFGDLTRMQQKSLESLDSVEEWSELDRDLRTQLVQKHKLAPIPELNLGTDEDLLTSLRASSLEEWDNKIHAMGRRAAMALEEAVRILMPAAVNIRPRPATLRNTDEVEAYLNALREEIIATIESGNTVVIT